MCVSQLLLNSEINFYYFTQNYNFYVNKWARHPQPTTIGTGPTKNIIVLLLLLACWRHEGLVKNLRLNWSFTIHRDLIYIYTWASMWKNHFMRRHYAWATFQYVNEFTRYMLSCNFPRNIYGRQLACPCYGLGQNMSCFLHSIAVDVTKEEGLEMQIWWSGWCANLSYYQSPRTQSPNCLNFFIAWYTFTHEILDGEVGNWVWGLGPFSTHDSDLS